MGDSVMVGTMNCCAGCGFHLGLGCIVIEIDREYPTEDPDWPFDEKDCPICAFRKSWLSDYGKPTVEYLADHVDRKTLSAALMRQRENR